jgi:hypothetical protein
MCFMSWLFRGTPDGDGPRRSVEHVSLTPSPWILGHLDRPPAGSGPSERKRIGMKRLLIFALGITVAAAACAGTILAMFAWTGAGL